MKEKPVSSRDVAKEAGVSQATVSYVLNNTKGIRISSKTCDAVNEAIRKLDYHPNLIARSMKLKRAMSIGVVTDKNVTSYGFIKTLEGLKDTLSSYNYSITLCEGQSNTTGEFDYENNTDSEYIRYFESSRIDGVIFLFADVSEETSDYLASKYIPYIIINTNSDNIEIPSIVSCDLAPGMDSAILHLNKSGINTIGYIGASAGSNKSMKYRCFKSSLELISNSTEDHFNYKCKNNEEDVLNVISARIADIPDAFICDSPGIGFYLLRYLSACRISVPGDVSIISIGASGYLSYSYPPMSSIEPPLYNMGVEGAEMIIKSINDSYMEEKTKLTWEFINRGSCRSQG